MTPLTHGLSGSAGEYYVAAELAHRGFIATVTSHGAESIDVLASRPNSGRAIKIQVKTTQGAKPHWVLRQSDEKDKGPHHFYVLVGLGAAGVRPDYYIVPGQVVAQTIQASHQQWLGGKKKNGQPRKDTAMRGIGAEVISFREKWSLLDEPGPAGQ